MDNSSETMEDIALINNLNDNCLKHIFSFLPVNERAEIEKVCKRWRSIGERGWNDVRKLVIKENCSDNEMYVVLKRCGRYLKTLKIYYNPEHSCSLSMVIKFCRLDQLEHFRLINIDFEKGDIIRNIRHFSEIFEKSKNLVCVVLHGILHRYMLDCLIFLNLKTLDLDNRNRRERLECNPDRFPMLEVLNLDNVNIFEEAMIRKEESLKALRLLFLDRCEVPENFLQRIGTFTNLQQFWLKDRLVDMKNEHIRHIARHCDKIQKMGVISSINLTSDCFQYLGEMRSLELLQLYEFPINSRDLAYLTNVKKLGFWRCHDIVEGNGLVELITNSSNLEDLYFLSIQALDRCFVSDIEQIFQCGQREKQLLVTLKDCAHELLKGLKKRTYHPLLTVRVENDRDDSETDVSGDDDDDDDVSGDDDDDDDDVPGDDDDDDDVLED